MPSLRHTWWFFSLFFFQLFSPPLYADLPVPKMWLASPVDDGTKKAQQVRAKFSASLKEYLRQSKRVEVEDGKTSKKLKSGDELLSKAESFKHSGVEAYKAKEYKKAERLLKESLDKYKASLSSMKDFLGVQQSLLFLAATFAAQDLSGDAKDTYRQLAAVVSDDFEFDSAIPEAVMARYKKAKKKLLKKKKGGVTIETVPPGATVFIDGVERCKTPCEQTNLSRGIHYIRVALEGQGDAGGVIKVKGGKSAIAKYNLTESKKEVKAVPIPPELITQIKESLTAGQIDAKLRVAVDEISNDQEVDYALLTLLMSHKRKIHLFTFLYHSADKQMVVLPPQKFSPDFAMVKLNARKLVGSVKDQIPRLKESSLIDGSYPPIIDLLKQIKDALAASAAASIAVVPPPPPRKKPPVRTQPPLISKDTKTLKPPKKNPTVAFNPPPKLASTKGEKVSKSRESIFSSPWFWTGVSVVIVGGAVAGGYLILENQSSENNQKFSAEVQW